VDIGPFDHQVLETRRSSKENNPSTKGGLIDVHK